MQNEAPASFTSNVFNPSVSVSKTNKFDSSNLAASFLASFSLTIN